MFNNIKFRQLLIEKELSQKEAAKKLGIHHVYLSMICRSLYQPSKKLTAKIAKLLKVDILDLNKE